MHNEYNRVLIGSKLADEQFLYGKGAGRYPTSSAVLSDIAALRYRYKYEYKKSDALAQYTLSQDYELKIYVSYGAFHNSIVQDFFQVEELYTSETRNYCIGIIHIETLLNAAWFNHKSVSTVFISIPEDKAVCKTQASTLYKGVECIC